MWPEKYDELMGLAPDLMNYMCELYVVAHALGGNGWPPEPPAVSAWTEAVAVAGEA